MAAQEKQPSKAAQVAGAAADSAANRVIFTTKKTVGRAINAAATAAATATGVLAPFAKPIGEVLGRIGEWVTLKAGTFIKRHKGAAAAAIAAPVLLLIGGIGGIPAAVGGGLFIVAGMIVAAFGGTIVGASLGFLFFAFIVLLIFVVLATFIINMSGYVVPLTGDRLFGSTGFESEFIKVEKSATPSGPFRNEQLPLELTYKVVITAKKVTLTNIRFANEYSVAQDPKVAPNPNPPPIPDPPASISIGQPHTIEYKVSFDPSFKDSLVTDRFTVTADAGEARNDTAVGVASVVIGKPPAGCPADWPVDTSQGQQYYVNQGPGGPVSHGPPSFIYTEAIDIHPAGSSGGRYNIVSTVSGMAYYGIDQYGGRDVSIIDNCGASARIDFVHMSKVFTCGENIPESELTPDIRTEVITISSNEFIRYERDRSVRSIEIVSTFPDGRLIVRITRGIYKYLCKKAVQKGEILGIMGRTGYASGVHLHYAFRDANGRNKNPSTGSRPPFMITPYIPKSVPRGCLARTGCGVEIP